MAFTDPRYLLFLGLAVVLAALARVGQIKLLAIVSLNVAFLSMMGDQWAMLPIVGIVAFVIARRIEVQREGPLRLSLFLIGLVALFSPLFYYKYFSVVYTRIFAHLSGLDHSYPFHIEALPIGLSFYTFLAAGYLIDVYIENCQAERSPLRFAAMMSFFPTVTSGPIERAEHFLPQLNALGRPNYVMIIAGLKALLLGVLLKFVVADTLAPDVNRVFSAPSSYGATDLWLANFYFAFQVYADFAGYSLIAIGSARLLGIELLPNFRQPYFSQTVSEFWRRWHISLSSWFRDYVFIPLQFRLRRRGGLAVAVALISTFALVGIWHGAGAKFVVFGFIHGILAVLSTVTLKSRDQFWKRVGMPPLAIRIGRIAITFFLVYLTLVLFRAGSLTEAMNYYRGMVSGFAAPTLPLLVPLIVVAISLAVDVILEVRPGANALARWSAYYVAIALICIFAVINTANGAGDVGFIYFRF